MMWGENRNLVWNKRVKARLILISSTDMVEGAREEGVQQWHGEVPPWSA